MFSENLISTLKRHEGYRQLVYKCPAGKLTIGYGLNLEDNGVTIEEAEYLMINNLIRKEDELKKSILYFDNLPDNAKDVLLNMAYQLGVPQLLRFRRMWAAISNNDWQTASTEMLDSRWAKQTPRRANELASIMANIK